MADMALHRLYIKNMMLTTALEYYADQNNWPVEILQDHGLFAQQTLELLKIAKEAEDKEQVEAKEDDV